VHIFYRFPHHLTSTCTNRSKNFRLSGVWPALATKGQAAQPFRRNRRRKNWS
jgi:hypothetical protein